MIHIPGMMKMNQMNVKLMSNACYIMFKSTWNDFWCSMFASFGVRAQQVTGFFIFAGGG